MWQMKSDDASPLSTKTAMCFLIRFAGSTGEPLPWKLSVLRVFADPELCCFRQAWPQRLEARAHLFTNSFGCSQAAKWPPLSSLL